MKDCRSHQEYKTEELVLGAIVLFLLKQDSRNAMDNLRIQKQFSKNYKRMFGSRCPSMDAVEDFYRKLDAKELEDVKALLIAKLIEKRVLHRFRLSNKWFVVAVDATGAHSSNHCMWKECTHKTSSKGKITYMNNVLEAKLVCSNGLSLSICSEWITNPTDLEYDKQDCELKAFKRLAVKLKKYFPRLPLCLVFDGLYCNSPVMDICRDNGWKWIAVFKDGSLGSIHQELKLLPQSAFAKHHKLTVRRQVRIEKKEHEEYSWVNDIDYSTHKIHWMQCLSTIEDSKGKIDTHRFEYLTNIEQSSQTIVECVFYARKRWNIEESFNDQKNRDFEMQHLFSRNSFTSFVNWYQTLQLAYNVYMFAIKSVEMVNTIKEVNKQTIKSLWSDLICVLKIIDIDDVMTEFEEWISSPRQVRLC